MPLSKYVFDASADNFSTLALENSRRGLVLVNFWTPKAGPCMVLMPRLVKLATEYGGKFLLVMLNTDELGSLARRIGVTSVPTVKFFRDGEVVYTIHGAEPDSTFHQALARFIADDSSTSYRQGLVAWKNGDLEQARQLLAQAAMDNPENASIAVDLTKLLWSSGEHEQALALLRNLPLTIRSVAEIENLANHLLLAHELVSLLAAEPDNLLVRYQLAARHLAENQIERALQELLEIVAKDRDWQEKRAINALVHLLDWLGAENPLAAHYRQLLASTLT
jgi:putative thioredoxin